MPKLTHREIVSICIQHVRTIKHDHHDPEVRKTAAKLICDLDKLDREIEASDY